MASQNPPVKNVGHTFYISLVSQADTRLLQVSPTLAAGDVKVAIDDGAPANLATLPVIDADFTKRVKVVMSSGEMNGDNITIVFSDAAGLEWCDMTINLQTVLRKFDDLAFPTTAGNSIDVTATGEVGIDWANIGGPTTTQTLSGTTVGTATTIGATGLAAIWDRLTSAITTTGSIGKLIKDTLDAAITTRMATFTYTAPDNADIVLIKAKTDNLPAAPAAVGDIPTAAVIADAVLDDAMTEPSGVFAWGTATPRKIFAWLGALSRNKMTQTATTSTLRDDADSGDLAVSTISDDGTTFTRDEWS